MAVSLFPLSGAIHADDPSDAGLVKFVGDLSVDGHSNGSRPAAEPVRNGPRVDAQGHQGGSGECRRSEQRSSETFARWGDGGRTRSCEFV
jgi:hypothetical protein